ncbi:MAG: response regulator transcription factor [Chitinophagales bacterium]|nr:response regulator transcription factor [Chitinophagales bacterium]
MRILLIEDEIPAARQLAKLLHEQVNGLEILNTLDSVEGAVHYLQQHEAPDLIFMDIQIADGLSFDIFQHVAVSAPVIFTTAFDQYAVQAFKVNAIDYLLKPIDPADLQQALQKVRERAQPLPAQALAQLTQFLRRDNYKERFLIKSGQHLVFLPTAEVACFRSESGVTLAYTSGSKKHVVEHSLEELENLLDPKLFFRISRSMTICLSAIKRISPHFNGRLKLELHHGPADEEIFVSRERSPNFKNWLDS